MFGVPVRDPHWKHLVKSCTLSHVSRSMAFSCESSGVVSSSGTESASEGDKKKGNAYCRTYWLFVIYLTSLKCLTTK